MLLRKVLRSLLVYRTCKGYSRRMVATFVPMEAAQSGDNEYRRFKQVVGSLWPKDNTNVPPLGPSPLKRFIELFQAPDDDLSKVTLGTTAKEAIRWLPTCSTTELCDLLFYLGKCKQRWRVNSKIVGDVLKVTDLLLTRRLLSKKNLSDEELNMALVVVNHWYVLGWHMRCKFNAELIQILKTTMSGMSKEELLRFCFVLSLCRRRMDASLWKDLQKAVQRFSSCLTLQEAAVVCAAFYKTKTKFTDCGLVESFIRSACRDFKNDDDLSLSCVLKAARYTEGFVSQPLLEDIVELCMNNSDVVSLKAVTHACMLLSTRGLYHNGALKWAMSMLRKNIHKARLKDIERIVNAVACFYSNALPPEAVTEINNEVANRVQEIEMHPHCFLSIVHYLVVLGHYPKHLIKRCLNPDFVKKCLESDVSSGVSLLSILCGVTIEMRNEFQDVVLNEDTVKRLQSDISPTPKTIDDLLKAPQTELSFHEKLLVDSYAWMKANHNGSVACVTTLPYLHYPDMLLCGHKNCAVVPKQGLEVLKDGSAGHFACIVLLNRNNYADSFHTRVSGLVCFKLRLLKALGFNVVTVPYYNIVGNLDNYKCFIKSLESSERVVP